MSAAEPLPCLVCGKEMQSAFGDPWDAESRSAPRGGTIFSSRGNYGSTVFDPGASDREKLEVVVCDDCLRMQIAGDRVRYSVIVKYGRDEYESRNAAELLPPADVNASP